MFPCMVAKGAPTSYRTEQEDDNDAIIGAAFEDNKQATLQIKLNSSLELILFTQLPHFRHFLSSLAYNQSHNMSQPLL